MQGGKHVHQAGRLACGLLSLCVLFLAEQTVLVHVHLQEELLQGVWHHNACTWDYLQTHGTLWLMIDTETNQCHT